MVRIRPRLAGFYVNHKFVHREGRKLQCDLAGRIRLIFFDFGCASVGGGGDRVVRAWAGTGGAPLAWEPTEFVVVFGAEAIKVEGSGGGGEPVAKV
jgi:hypothetical protein